jgi:hypothetical protein
MLGKIWNFRKILFSKENWILWKKITVKILNFVEKNGFHGKILNSEEKIAGTVLKTPKIYKITKFTP